MLICNRLVAGARTAAVTAGIAHTSRSYPARCHGEASSESHCGRRGREVVVLGAGVIGVTSAYCLARAGYKVTVIDREHSVALGASQVNACSLRVSSFSPFNNPKSLWRFGKALLTGDPVFRVAWTQVLPDPAFWRWGLLYCRACLLGEWTARSTAYLRDASQWSVALTAQVADQEGIEFHHNGGATLTFLDEQSYFDAAIDSIPSKEAAGINVRVLDRDALMRAQPSLAVGLGSSVLGALHCEQDRYGDCRKFTEGLAAVCASKYGVTFKHNSTVFALERSALTNTVVAVHTSCGRVPVHGDVVLCMGSQSDRVAQSVGVRLPIYPMKGYSITVDVGELATASPDSVPKGLLVLEPVHTYVTRMDKNRLRFASIAEFAGWDVRHITPECADAVRSRAAKWFPQLEHAIYSERTKVLTGGRPQTPDDLPIVSATPVPNLYVNSGHGQFGWRLACSSAEILESLISHTPAPAEAPDIQHLSLERFNWF